MKNEKLGLSLISLKLPENRSLRYTSCRNCPLSEWNYDQQAYWCSKFRSHYDADDGCSKGPNG